jgi:hypothetical protein
MPTGFSQIRDTVPRGELDELASVQLAVETSVHSKASRRRTDEGCEGPRLFAKTRRFSSLRASIRLKLRLVED